MECPNCGKENRPVARFCQYCGTLLEPAQVSAGEPEGTEAAGYASVEEKGTPEHQDEEASSALEELNAAVEGTEPGAQVGASVVEPDEQTWIEALDLEEERATEAAEPVDMAVQVEEAALTEPAVKDRKTAEPGLQLEASEAVDVVLLAPEQEGPEEVDMTPPEPSASIEGESQESNEGGEVADSEVEADEELLTQGDANAALQVNEPYLSAPGGQDVRIPPREHAAEVQELTEAGLLPWQEEDEVLTPMEPGTVVQGRYQVTQVVEERDQEILYKVRDLQRCPQCGFTGNAPDEAFCGSCGAAMDHKPIALMRERLGEANEVCDEEEAQDRFSEGGRSYVIWREERKTGPLGGADQRPRPIVGHRSDTGQVRELDEDSIFVLTMSYTLEAVPKELGLFVVADGMGGHEAGEMASRIAIQALTGVLLRGVFHPELEGASLTSDQIQASLEQAVQAANDQVYLERQKRDNDMGTTVTVALSRDWTLYLAHVGDSRAYRWGEDGLQQLTTDHSLVASMVAAGTAQPEEIYSHPQRSVIYRSVGDKPRVEVDSSTMLLSPGDRLLLCSDGLWEMIRNEGIEDVMLRESDPQVACDMLVNEANVAGGVDNISAIVVQF